MKAASAGNAAAVRSERLMSEHDQQLQIVREDHTQEVSHRLPSAALGSSSAGQQMIIMMMIMLFIALFRNKLRTLLTVYEVCS